MKNSIKVLEDSIIGILLEDFNLFSKINNRLTSEHFENINNKFIFSMMEKIFVNNEKFDLNILIAMLDSSKLNEFDFMYWRRNISSLIASSGMSFNIEIYAKQLNDYKQIKDLESNLSSLLSDIKNNDKKIEEIILEIENEISKTAKKIETNELVALSELLDDFEKEFEKKINDEDYGSDGIKVKIPQLDEITGGFKKGEFVVIAARPSMGKTAFSLQMISNISKNQNTAFFSLEMPTDSIIKRLVSLESSLSQNIFRNYKNIPQNNVEMINKSLFYLKNKNIWIDDTPGLRINDLIWKIKKLNSSIEGGLDIVFIDYLQLIESDGKVENRQQSISNISRSLKTLARELDIPVVSLSQLSRKVETREEKRPMMSDLRESGAIEQDSDVIILLYRPNYYSKEKNSSILEELEAIVAKNRNGKVDTAYLDMNMENGRITSKAMEGEI